MVSRKKWIDSEEFLNLVAIAESTPGPIAINTATYIGYRMHGFWGALAATTAICIPSFCIIYFVSLFFDTFLSLPLMANAFKGIQVCVIYLIFSAGLKLFRTMKKNIFSLFIFFAVLIGMMIASVFAVKFSSVLVILFCGCLGLFFSWIGCCCKRGNKP